jgi:hypothetical protein
VRDLPWQPAPNSRVRVEPKDDALSPPGVWRVLAHGPSAPTAWWIYAHDDEARQWVDANRRQTTSGCVEITGNRLIPAHRQLSLEPRS